MIDLSEIAREVIKNRERRGFPSAHDLSKTTAGLAEEVGEWAKAHRKNNHAEMVDALVDIIVYCLGGLEILEEEPEAAIITVIEQNKVRSHSGHH